VQTLADVHDTPSSTPPGGFGVRWIVQLLPFQRSANVKTGVNVFVVPHDPTAVHALADVHDTPDRPLSNARGLGVGWIVQLLPCHSSANVTPTAVSAPPTAVQAVLDVHDTPDNRLKSEPAGLGVDSIVQLLPCQRCANVTKMPALLTAPPTEVHCEIDVHDTPDNRLKLEPAGLGVDWIDHPDTGVAAATPGHDIAATATPTATTTMGARIAAPRSPTKRPPGRAQRTTGKRWAGSASRSAST
jgi:hypothetical protein